MALPLRPVFVCQPLCLYGLGHCLGDLLHKFFGPATCLVRFCFFVGGALYLYHHRVWLSYLGKVRWSRVIVATGRCFGNSCAVQEAAKEVHLLGRFCCNPIVREMLLQFYLREHVRGDNVLG